MRNNNAFYFIFGLKNDPVLKLQIHNFMYAIMFQNFICKNRNNMQFKVIWTNI